MCQYDLSEADRRPILQAEALKEKNKVISSLRNEIALLRGESTKFDLDDTALASQQKIRLPPRSPKASQQQSRHSQGDDYAFSGESSIIGVADDVCRPHLLAGFGAENSRTVSSYVFRSTADITWSTSCTGRTPV